MKNYYPPLLPGAHYHIFNRGNNRETVFYSDGNYQYFLGKYAKYLSPVLDTYAYCLLPNHFHLVVRVKTADEIAAALAAAGAADFPDFNIPDLAADFPGFKNLESLALAGDDVVGRFVSNRFRLCFMSYAKALNKQKNRTGSLFQKNFKRLAIDSDHYFSNLILYVHANPQLHGIWDDYRDWPHSSYQSILSDGGTRLRRQTVLGWFGGKSAFADAHQHYLKLKIDETLMIED